MLSSVSVVLNMVQGLRNFAPLAVPFFILIGEIMGTGGMTGSAVADTSTNGSILIPMMKKECYDDGYSVLIPL